MHMLNGKLYPFIYMSVGSVRDYVDPQRLMFALNTHYRSRSFQVFGDTTMAYAFRENIRIGFEDFVRGQRSGGSGHQVEVLPE